MYYGKLLLTTIVSFFIMYGVMFLNIDEASHIYVSTTRYYMSILMVCPMIILMLTMMRKMYRNKTLNASLIVSAIILFSVALICLRTQAFIGDREYMKAMIPHHSSAILTSKHASIKDLEVKALSEQIIRSQEEEIAQMKRILERMNKEEQSQTE